MKQFAKLEGMRSQLRLNGIGIKSERAVYSQAMLLLIFVAAGVAGDFAVALALALAFAFPGGRGRAPAEMAASGAEEAVVTVAGWLSTQLQR